MQNTSLVFSRHQDQWQNTPTVFLGTDDAEWFTGLSTESVPAIKQGSVYTHDIRTYQQLTQRLPQLSVHFGALLADAVEKSYLPEQAMITVPKSRALLDFWLAQLNAILPSGSSVWLVGEKKAGIQGASKQLSKACSQARKLDSARHCQLWRGELLGNNRSDSECFELSQWQTEFEVQALNQTVLLTSIPGVFNHGDIDAGTRLLLDTFESHPPIAQGRVLDFGSGTGVLGIVLQKQHPELLVDALDVSAYALYATERSAKQNQVQINPVASDGLSELDTNARYDCIVSNPPFHTGQKTDLSIAQQFFKDAFERLNTGGELRIVANAHLPYASAIEHHFGHCETLDSTHKFCVYRARKK